MKIETFADRSKQRVVSALVMGKSGVGKTSLCNDFTEPTLLIDMESGDLSVNNELVDKITVKTRDELVNLACLIGGHNPAIIDPAEDFSQHHFETVSKAVGGRDQFLGKYKTIVFDSLTEMGRIFLKWAEKHPTCVKNGQPDIRGAYGLLAREGLRMLHHIKHTTDKNIVFVCILEEIVDDFGRKTQQPQIEGSKIARELSGIMDEVFTMDFYTKEVDGKKDTRRVFYTSADNEFGFPAKDRSGVLKKIELANLETVFKKIAEGKQNG